MRIDGAAAYLGVTTRTIDRYIEEQGLPVHRIGTGPKPRKYFFRSDLDEWLRNRWSARTAGEAAS